MKIDFHTHGKLAKHLYFSEKFTNNTFDTARRNGLDAICLTEHFNTTNFFEFYEYVDSISERDGDCLVLENGLRIFPGVEVDIKEGGHLLCVGKMEDILAIRKKLENCDEEDSFLSFRELTDLIDSYPVLLGAGHPFRNSETSNIPDLPYEDLQRLDYVDLNGKDLAVEPDDMEERVRNFAESINKPVIAGSDAHQEKHYGVVYNIFERDLNTIEGLYEEVLKSNYEIYISDKIAETVSTALLIKSLLKEIDALGGDYVEAALRCKE
ncbi:MAG: PHP domain-containing protein [Ruminococcaceae bacterium]|nr:PHP domain-containing protein [Oscillospiraceae bacterium]